MTMLNKSRLTMQILAACVAFLSSCQNDKSLSPYLPKLASLEFQVDETHRQPDSVRWGLRGWEDAADLARVPRSNTFVATFMMPELPENDRVHLQLWRDGIRTDIVPCAGSTDLTSFPKEIERDSVAYAILKMREILQAKDSVRYPDSASGARRAFAKMLVDRDAATKGALAKGLPYGIDTALLVDEICRAMASTKRSFDGLWSADHLGGDSLGWVDKIRSRVARKILEPIDSARLFPPLPVRVESPVNLAKKLVAGGDEIAIEGRFGWFPGLVSLDAFVLSGKDTVRGVFDVALDQPRRKTDTIWALAGKANIRARSKAVKGTYTLAIVARDTKGRRAVSVSPLEVVDPAPGTPRLSRIEPAGGDTILLPFEKSSLHLAFKVLNPEDLDDSKVTIGGVRATKKSATEWEGDVAVPPTGRPVIVSMRAVGKNGEPGTDYLLVVRAGDPVPPRIDSVDGSADRTVSFATTSAQVRWKASDNHKVDLVEIGGIEASELDSIYSRTVPLAIGENLIEIEAFDSSRNSTRKVTKIVRSKDDQAPLYVRDLGAHDTDIASQSVKFVLMGWQITDNHRVESVTIGGSVAERSAGFFYRVVPVETGVTKIAMVARDSSGNQSTDTVVVRKDPNPGYPVLKALPGTESRTVGFDVPELALGWQVLNPRSLRSVAINGTEIVGVDAVYSVRIALAVGDTIVRIQATDTLGASTIREVKITRKPDTLPPLVAQGRVHFSTLDGKTTAEVAWVVEDNGRLESVKIDGIPVLPVGNVYSRTFVVPSGQDTIRIEAVDAGGNSSFAKVAVDRTPDTKAPQIVAGVGAQSREVEAGTDMILVSWTVTDENDVASVTIGGQSVLGKSGVYAAYVALAVGTNAIEVVAKDATGNEASQEVKIVRKP